MRRVHRLVIGAVLVVAQAACGGGRNDERVASARLAVRNRARFESQPAGKAISVTLPAATSATVGVPIQLVAQVKDKNGKTVNGVALTWASSDPTVASVSNGGLLTPLRGGAATVTASASGAVGSTLVTVRDPVAASARPATSAPTWPASPTGRPKFPFADLMKSGMGWRSLEAGDVWDAPFPALTADGYPAALKPGQRAVSAVAWYDSHYPAGRYVVLWDGAGSIGFPDEQGHGRRGVGQPHRDRRHRHSRARSGSRSTAPARPIRFATCASSGPAPNPPTRCSRSTRSS
jgi:hypothetical protein